MDTQIEKQIQSTEEEQITAFLHDIEAVCIKHGRDIRIKSMEFLYPKRNAVNQ